MRFNPFTRFSTKAFLKTAAILFVIFLVLTCVLVLKTNQVIFANFLGTIRSSGRSTAEVWVDKNYLFLKFKVTEEERAEYLRFLKNLGIDKTEFEEIRLEVDPESAQKLDIFLPATLTVNFDDKTFSFKDKQVVMLQSGLSKSAYELATEGGKLKVLGNSLQDFSLEAEEPFNLLKYATESGQINLAQKTYEVFPIIAKIARINLRVNGKSIIGEIRLK